MVQGSGWPPSPPAGTETGSGCEREADVDETGYQHADDHEGDDPRGLKARVIGVPMTAPFVRRAAVPGRQLSLIRTADIAQDSAANDPRRPDCDGEGPVDRGETEVFRQLERSDGSHDLVIHHRRAVADRVPD
jgi:hypothetical protein